MKILLDTHIWIWYLLGLPKFNRRQLKLLQDDSNELWLSPISVWEVTLLIEKKRLPIAMPPQHWIKEALQVVHVKEARLSFEIAMLAREIPLEHDDPADRFIAATAIKHGLHLMTADKRLIKIKSINLC